MTIEIEKQFFNTFGIEPRGVKRTLELAMPGYDENDLPEDLRQFIDSQTQVYHIYPEITDRILLELICIANQEDVYIEVEGTDIETMKNKLLGNFIHFRRLISEQQVRTLFEEVKK